MRLSIKSVLFAVVCFVALGLGSPSAAEAAHGHHHTRVTHGRGHKKHRRPRSHPKAKSKPKEEAAQQRRDQGFEL